MQEVSGADLESILSSATPKLVMFHTKWCGFCHIFNNVFDEACKSSTGIEFFKVDLSESDNPIWESYKISVVPTIIGFKNSKIVTRRDGKLARGLSRKDLQDTTIELQKS